MSGFKKRDSRQFEFLVMALVDLAALTVITTHD
jgi:hypothetical protein